MVALLQSMGRRLRQKLAALLPILLAAGALFLLLSLILYLVRPYLPAGYQRALQLVEQGDLIEARDYLRAAMERQSGGPYAVFIGLQVAQVLFAPIPGQLVGLLGGYLFGFWRGIAVTTAGLALGSGIAFLIARLLGLRLVSRVVPEAVFGRFERLINRSSPWDFFLIFLLPLFPDDAVCFIAGLTRLPLWQLLLVSIAGRTPWMAVLTYFGAGAAQDTLWTSIILGVIVVAGLLIWLYSDELEAWFERLTRRQGDKVTE